jgi:hypothetical protein
LNDWRFRRSRKDRSSEGQFPVQNSLRLNDFATEKEIAQVTQLEQTTGEALLKRDSLSHPMIATSFGLRNLASISVFPKTALIVRCASWPAS